MTVVVYDTKPYDRAHLATPDHADIDWRFHEFRLSASTAFAAEGALAVCAFVNDEIDAPCLERLAEMGVKLVAMRSAGFNNVDIDAAKKAGVTVCRVPAYSPNAVAEHAIGLLLTLNRKIHRAYNRVREQNFSLNGLVGFDLAGRTIGVVGTGKIGRIAAQICRGFGMTVLVSDPQEDPDWAREIGVRYVRLPELFSESDIITLHAPLLLETYHLIKARTISQMKRGVTIVNTSRGKLIDTGALIDGLKSGQIGGVALDVYEEEEGVFFEDHSGEVLQDDELARLLSFHNVLVTSHQAFLTEEALNEIARVTTANIRRFGAGEALLEGTTI